MEPKNELQRNAIQEARRKELESYQRALDVQWLNSRMEDGRMGRSLALIQREAEMEKDFQERTDHAAIVNARAEEEARLGMEISQVRDEEVNELMRRHQLREHDPSLRDLQKKLQAGYVCRDLQQQILNNEYRRMQDKVEEGQANQVMLNALYNDMEQTEREEKHKMEQNTQYCRDLQQQLVNKQRQKQCQYEDTLIEKKMQEDIMRTIADEDQRELQQKRESTEKMRDEMETFQGARAAWKEKQKEMVVIEEKKIEEQQQAASDRSSAIVAEREKKMHEREEQIDKIGQKILSDQASRQEREDTILQLQQQEYLERGVQDGRAEQQRRDSFREEARQDRATQLERRQLDAQQLHDEDEEYRRQANEQMAKEDERELEKERVKRQKNQEYGNDLRRQIEDNARRRKAEKELEQQRAQSQWDHEEAWRSDVAAEREKIVEEHVPNLIGYLQPGVVRHDDLPALEAGASRDQQLADLDVASLAGSDRPEGHPKCNAQCRVLREY